MSPRSERQKQRYAEDPKYRARILASNLRYSTTHKEEIAAKARDKWATDPAFRAKGLAAACARDSRADKLKQLYGLSTHDHDAMLRAERCLRHLQAPIREQALRRPRPRGQFRARAALLQMQQRPGLLPRRSQAHRRGDRLSQGQRRRRPCRAGSSTAGAKRGHEATLCCPTVPCPRRAGRGTAPPTRSRPHHASWRRLRPQIRAPTR